MGTLHKACRNLGCRAQVVHKGLCKACMGEAAQVEIP